jgi:site-specific recombinase XerD
MASGGVTMNSLNLASPLAPHIQKLIERRQSCGMDYRTQAKLLTYFDRFLVQENVKKEHITRPIIERYQKTLSHLAPRYQANRFGVVRQLCQYLALHDVDTFIPEPMKRISADTAHKPYIYSHLEVKSLMNGALALPPVGSLRPYTYHTLLGLLYSTGIRISEACSLNLESFHADKQCLYIAQGKFRKARWIPLHDSTRQALEHYIDRRLSEKPNAPADPLLLHRRGRRLCYATVYYTFRHLLDQCGITGPKHSNPRIHDVRHTYAVHRLLAWYQDGQDINARLAILATYMGHVDIRSTQLYLRPTAELLGHVSDRFHDYYLRTIDSKGGTS